MDRQLINRITINYEICHGRPTIRNTRYTVDLILDLLSAGMSEAEIIEDYPAFEASDFLSNTITLNLGIKEVF